MLVDIVDKSWGRLLKLNAIAFADGDAELWRGDRILVFNSWNWWLHRGKKQLWDFVTYGDHLYEDMDRLVAYEKALSSWAQRVDENIDFTKTKVFFQGISPTHMKFDNLDNNLKPSTCFFIFFIVLNCGENCREETRPVFGPPYPRKRLPAEVIVERVIGKMSQRVHLPNITRLSQQRNDAHPSVYGKPERKIGMDCSHWCLPGVPDTWNEL
ncbi:hypothetical protein K1719_014283 [Acacia pycnantha]|nr:hypothetical protein K1719_014283 [Acacia pycnantha]